MDSLWATQILFSSVRLVRAGSVGVIEQNRICSPLFTNRPCPPPHLKPYFSFLVLDFALSCCLVSAP